jgi:hypothetical protein
MCSEVVVMAPHEFIWTTEAGVAVTDLLSKIKNWVLA